MNLFVINYKTHLHKWNIYSKPVESLWMEVRRWCHQIQVDAILWKKKMGPLKRIKGLGKLGTKWIGIGEREREREQNSTSPGLLYWSRLVGNIPDEEEAASSSTVNNRPTTSSIFFVRGEREGGSLGGLHTRTHTDTHTHKLPLSALFPQLRFSFRSTGNHPISSSSSSPALCYTRKKFPTVICDENISSLIFMIRISFNHFRPLSLEINSWI